jgi:hypothetical protein
VVIRLSVIKPPRQRFTIPREPAASIQKRSIEAGRHQPNFAFTPSSAWWLNMVERFFRDNSEKRLRRGVSTSVQELVTAIKEYVAHHNTSPKPFIRTKGALFGCLEIFLFDKSLFTFFRYRRQQYD